MITTYSTVMSYHSTVYVSRLTGCGGMRISLRQLCLQQARHAAGVICPGSYSAGARGHARSNRYQ